VLLALALVAGGCSGAAPERSDPTSAPAAGRRDVTDADFAAIRELLDVRAKAVVTGDRDAFLATVDPQGPLRDEQEVFFDNLQDLDVQKLYYGLVDTGLVPEEVRGGEALVRPELYEHVQLRGVNQRPVANQVSITFVARDGRWYVGHEELDKTFEAQSRPWFGTRIDVAGDRDLLVLTDRGATVSADYLLDATRTALAGVADLLGVRADDPLLVDATTNGLPYQLSNASAEDAAAVAFGTYASSRTGTDYQGRAGSVVKANPKQVSYLVNDGVVLWHELTHFVLDTEYLDEMPQWASEGIAEYVGQYPDLLADSFAPNDELRDRLDDREVRLIPPGRWGDDPEVDYLYARAFAEYLVERYGMAKYVELLHAYVRIGRDDRFSSHLYGEGLDDEVLEDVYGTTPGTVARGGFALVR
jgi:hypothetical protein